MSIGAVLDRFVGPHYGHPRGWLGRYAGRRMLEQHAPENDWTIALLEVLATDRIIEIGFGGGYSISKLCQRVTHGFIAGADYSPTMVAMASQRNASAIKQGRLDLRCADAAALPFETASFDKAYSIHSIYFWPQPQLALREVWRVLKPGAKVVLTVLPKERFKTQSPDDLEADDFKAYSGAALQALLADAGFVRTWIEDVASAVHLSNYSVIGIK